MIRFIHVIIFVFVSLASFSQKKGSLFLSVESGIGLNFTLSDFWGPEDFSKTPTFALGLDYKFLKKPLGIYNSLAYNKYKLVELKLNYLTHNALINVEAGKKAKFIVLVGLSQNFLVSHKINPPIYSQHEQDFLNSKKNYLIGLVGGFGFNYYLPKKNVIGFNIIYTKILGTAFNRTYNRNMGVSTSNYHLSGVNIILRYSYILFKNQE